MVAASAQERGTLVLKSGERISGELVDMGGRDFTFRVNGNDQTYAIGDVAVIDFAGSGQSFPAEELSRAADGLVVLRDGGLVSGRLSDVGGTRPLRLTFRVGSADREYSSADIARIYLTSPPVQGGQAVGRPLEPGGTGGIRVLAQQQWTATGITVRRGQVVRFAASGEIRLSEGSDDIATPDGARNQRYAQNAPMPRVLVGALIGRVGASAPFGIGTQPQIPMPAAGQLFLGINDDHVADNEGAFNVVVTPGR